ncbi:MAG: N-acetylmuramoyl-L-alanine amidase [Candidatus Pacebacteria bacterium]|nr:N-acetylmuramoyl-L-alanine amidase [Candidatus Paceibacterota bacterium]
MFSEIHRKVFLLSLAIFALPVFLGIEQCFAATSLPSKILTTDIKKHYDQNKFKILIVPGHDGADYGTNFYGIKEADLNLKLATKIFQLLNKNPHFQAYISRDENGYSQFLKNYFSEQKDLIENFRQDIKALFSQGFYNFKEKEGVPHNEVSDRIANKLYGMNKWANDNAVDLVIHVHFNDYAERRYHSSGQYTGFSIYIPEGQLPNHGASKDLAGPVFNSLKSILAVSDLDIENAGIVEDQKLIAVGANASLSSAAMLIEYGYIYEPHFIKKQTQDSFFDEMALLTYSGLVKYFEPQAKINKYDSAVLPYKWKNKLTTGMKNNKDVLAMQIALAKEGVYPPPSKDFHDCPISGTFLNCTKESVSLFQKKYSDDILKKTANIMSMGIADALTINKLNFIYAK